MDDFEVAELTHHFQEWIKHQPTGGGRKHIPLEDVLEALGLQDLSEALVAEARHQESVDELESRVG